MKNRLSLLLIFWLRWVTGGVEGGFCSSDSCVWITLFPNPVVSRSVPHSLDFIYHLLPLILPVESGILVGDFGLFSLICNTKKYERVEGD